jgi:hypothetical protein
LTEALISQALRLIVACFSALVIAFCGNLGEQLHGDQNWDGEKDHPDEDQQPQSNRETHEQIPLEKRLLKNEPHVLHPALDFGV